MEKAGKRVTLKMIAELAGVDKAIVSKVVNHVGEGEVGAEKRKKIEALIRQYNYVPLAAARSLATRRSGQIAFLLSDSTTQGLANGVFAEILSGVIEECRRRGYLCQVESCDFSRIEHFVLPENLKRRSVDGCILTGGFSPDVLAPLASAGVPLVLYGGEALREKIPVISRDSSVDYPVVLDYCRARGHRRVWVLGVHRHSRENYLAYQKLHPEMSIETLTPPAFAVKDEFAFGSFFAARFLELPPSRRPTMLYATEQFCCAFASHLARFGVFCPEHYSIISGGDSALSRYYFPALTVFGSNGFHNGEIAVRVLVEMLEKNLSHEEAVKLAAAQHIVGRIIERDSVKTLIQEG